MSISDTGTLFSARSHSMQRSYSLVISALLHGTAIALTYCGLVYAPQVSPPLLSEKYAVRHLDLHAPEPLLQQSTPAIALYAAVHSIPVERPAGDGLGASPAASREAFKPTSDSATLLQRDLLHEPVLPAVPPIPAIVIWTPQKTVARTIVLPLPQKATAADVRPALDPPNEAMTLDDVSVAPSAPIAVAASINPSTTSPLVERRLEAAQMVPVTTSPSVEQPTPAAVMSVSDLRMREGTVALPPGSRTASANSSNALTAKPSLRASVEGKGGSAQQIVATTGIAMQGIETAEGAYSTEVIRLPRDGKFGVVLVGSSLEERFPETAQVWAGRMTYTVYLPVGLASNWILQYSLPQRDDASGNKRRVEAPWPYDIVRPAIHPGDIDADALMIHGFVNRSGRFEGLTILFPSEFTQARFVLSALEQWHFRPAMQNGDTSRVEVLLIIPEDPQ
jgi:hypothetical protein